MITKYTYYIIERNSSFFQKLTQILSDIVVELNNEIVNDNNTYKFKVSYDESENSFKILFLNHNKILDIFIRQNGLRLETMNCANAFKIEELNNLDIKNLLKDKILIAYVIYLITRDNKTICYSNHIGLDNTIDEIVNILMSINNYNFIYFLDKDFSPKYIKDKYNYLLNAKNFDLI